MSGDQNVVLLTPIASKEEVKKSLNQFLEYKTHVLDKDDIQEFHMKDGKAVKFCKKAGCQKLALAFNISVDIMHQEVERNDGEIIARVQAKAVHLPSGRYFTAIAACSSKEKEHDVKDPQGKVTGTKIINEKRIEHDVLTHAQTRASNRAILSVLGSGEVSAEEMEHEGSTKTIKKEEKLDPERICNCSPEEQKRNPVNKRFCINCKKVIVDEDN